MYVDAIMRFSAFASFSSQNHLYKFDLFGNGHDRKSFEVLTVFIHLHYEDNCYLSSWRQQKGRCIHFTVILLKIWDLIYKLIDFYCSESSHFAGSREQPSTLQIIKWNYCHFAIKTFHLMSKLHFAHTPFVATQISHRIESEFIKRQQRSRTKTSKRCRKIDRKH